MKLNTRLARFLETAEEIEAEALICIKNILVVTLTLFIAGFFFAVLPCLLITSTRSAFAQPIYDQIPATIDADNGGITADTTLEAATNNMRLLGWTARESAGTAAVATVILRHGVVSGGSCTGNVIAYIELAANGSDHENYAPLGLSAASGVCADVLSGTVDVNIFTLS